MAATGFSFTKIHVADLAAGERFYTTVLGLKPGFRATTGDGPDDFEELQLSVNGLPGDVSLMLVQYLHRPAPPAGEAIIGFTVENIEDTIAAAVAAGGRVVHPIQTLTEYGMKIAHVADQQGHMVELLQLLG